MMCTPVWLVRSRVCCWRSTTPSFCTCLSHLNHCAQRSVLIRLFESDSKVLLLFVLSSTAQVIINQCFILRWTRLLLCFRPTRPRKLLRSPPPLLGFPVSKVGACTLILFYALENWCMTEIMDCHYLFYRMSILKPASPMEKEKN